MELPALGFRGNSCRLASDGFKKAGSCKNALIWKSLCGMLHAGSSLAEPLAPIMHAMLLPLTSG